MNKLYLVVFGGVQGVSNIPQDAVDLFKQRGFVLYELGTANSNLPRGALLEAINLQPKLVDCLPQMKV